MSFARTKIQQPRPRAALLMPRPELERALVSALETQRVVLVCAPAGYGKTATLGRAIEQLPAGHAAAWVSLDEGDDLHRLLACLMAALEPFDPPWRTSPEGLMVVATRPGGNAQQAVAEEIVNTLDACDIAHGVIVLDDLHHLSDPASMAFLDHWLQRMSPRWTVAIAARHEPPLRLARLRAAGELADFRESQLRFARDEVRLLAQGAGLDSETADALHMRTAGWAAGLRLALNGARGGSSGSVIDRQAFEFLATEVLARVDPALREFLLLASVLPEMDATRCAFVTGSQQAARWLDQIERLGLFATVVDDETPPTLRLHDLFRDALQHRLRLERPDERPQLLARAAEVESDPVRRQALLLAAGRPDEAARALLDGAARFIAEGAVQTLLRLIDDYPPGYALGSAELQRVAGLARWAVWNGLAAERHMALADALFVQRGELAAACTARAYRALTLAGIGRLDDASALLASLREHEADLEREARLVSLVARSWHALEGGSLRQVAPIFETVVTIAEAMDRTEVWYLTQPPPRQLAYCGGARSAARWAAGALAACGDRPLPLREIALLAQGWLALWQGRLVHAHEFLLRAEADAQWTGLHVQGRNQGMLLRGMLHAVRGERDAAVRVLQVRDAEYPAADGHWGQWYLWSSATRVAAACGDLGLARDWIRRLDALRSALPGATPARLQSLTALLGTLAALEQRRTDAHALWRAALEDEEHMDVLGYASEVRVRLALLLVEDAALTDAALVLAPVLAGGDAWPGGALLAGDALCSLAATNWGSALPAAQLATLVRWASLLRDDRGPARDAGADDASATQAAASASLEGPLTAREFEVLAQIAAGASNKLIARALDLSPHTVKRHVAHILGKLDLASRGQAAAWYHAEVGSSARPAR